MSSPFAYVCLLCLAYLVSAIPFKATGSKRATAFVAFKTPALPFPSPASAAAGIEPQVAERDRALDCVSDSDSAAGAETW